MDITFGDILQAITALGVLYSVYVVSRKMPGEIKQTLATAKAVEATAAQDSAETESVGIANQGSLYQMYKQVTDDYSTLDEKYRLRMRTLSDQVDALEAKFKNVSRDLETMTERAEAAEKKVAELEQRIIDYPERVVQLENIIKDLRAEVERLQGITASDAKTRKLEAETKAVANSPQQPPSAANDDAHAASGTAEALVDAIDVALDEKEAGKPPKPA